MERRPKRSAIEEYVSNSLYNGVDILGISKCEARDALSSALPSSSSQSLLADGSGCAALLVSHVMAAAGTSVVGIPD
jgi:hypothetical protein